MDRSRIMLHTELHLGCILEVKQRFGDRDIGITLGEVELFPVSNRNEAGVSGGKSLDFAAVRHENSPIVKGMIAHKKLSPAEAGQSSNQVASNDTATTLRCHRERVPAHD